MDDDDEDDYIFYGTPLQDFETFSLIKKQTADLKVRDEQGRQRFHGAFTGGFSAGYFNTVGSKEGWIPANFVSSRSQKAGSVSQNPEDFMDEEDFGAFGIAPKTVRTTSNFRDADVPEPNIKRRRMDDTDTIIPGEPPLKELVKPTDESIGITILKKMGWRHGQGIGPKVKRDTGIKMYGCSLGPLGSQDKENSDFGMFEFAPDDAVEVKYKPKDDWHGIGYSGLSTEAILNATNEFSASSTKTWLPKEKKKIGIRGQAFGVGALEDDDDDIYGREDMSQYDFSEFLGVKPVESKSSSNSDRKNQSVHGIVTLEGFCQSTKSSATKKKYPLPVLPKDFTPKHLKRNVAPACEISKQKLSPAARSILLGEKISMKSVENATYRHEAEKFRSRFCPAPEEERPMFPPGLIGSLSVKPFSNDEEKQQRYEKYLQSRGDKEELSLIQPSYMTEWQKQQEFDEFSKTASLYKPFSTGLKSRFEHKSHRSTSVSPGAQQETIEKKSGEKLEKKSDQPCREVFEWHPSSLLCKRFNIPNPYPDSNFEGTPESRTNKKPSLFGGMFFEDPELQDKVSYEESKKAELSVSHLVKDDSNSEKKTQEGYQNVGHQENAQSTEQEKEKPSMDLFRDIFKSSSSEDEPDEIENEKVSDVVAKEQDSKTGDPSQPKASIGNQTTPTTSSDSMKKQAFGVFANLDLDAINRRTPATSKTTKDPEIQIEHIDTSQDTTSKEKIVEESDELKDNDASEMKQEEDFYGPELPPPGTSILSSGSDWKSQQPLVHHKHSKHKHHKHKVKKKKKKKKKKKHSTKDESSSSVDSDDDDIPPALLIEKLKKLQKLERGKK